MPNKDSWTIGRMLEWLQGYLADHADPDPLISARWLISDVTGLSFMQLYTNIDRPFDGRELDKLRSFVKRRANGEPLQYITGKTTFRFIELNVCPGVLIPRPETEVLVSEVLSALPRDKHVSDTEACVPDILVCDLCCGSGCIAASLAYENPRIKVIATDVSSKCVKLARENVSKLHLQDRVEVKECDLASGIDQALIGHFDAVVSNPPYIPSSQLQQLPSEVGNFEPKLALDGGEDGLDVFRRICAWAYPALKQGGLLACELHEDTCSEAIKIASNSGFVNIIVTNDLNDLPRVISASKG